MGSEKVPMLFFVEQNERRIWGISESLLTNNDVFSFYYGSVIYHTGNYQQVIKMLSKSCQLSSNPNAFVLLGNNYRNVGDFQAAQMTYKTAIYMQPGRLYPKYLFAELYDEMNDIINTRYWASEILETSEKVSTSADKEIKNKINYCYNFK